MAYTVVLEMIWLVLAKNIQFIFLGLTLSDTEKKWPLSGPQCTHTLCSRNTGNFEYCQLKQFLYTLFLAIAKVHAALTETIEIIGRSKAEAEKTSGANQNLKSSFIYKLNCHSSCSYLYCGL